MIVICKVNTGFALEPEQAEKSPIEQEKSFSSERSNEARFFIMKSFNLWNLCQSIEQEIWATSVRLVGILYLRKKEKTISLCIHVKKNAFFFQSRNSRELDNAFLSARRVVLIFSVNNSRNFQVLIYFFVLFCFFLVCFFEFSFYRVFVDTHN